ncbi:YdeI/OmpD-associated family protein [Nocardia sp. NPDC051052]|uniref:YdeI/OmpD-associated family protein n=1 Tax=Nocardia sp. NPDC051052 TaxID=3364322 RepID=UPI00379B19A6
MKFWTHVEPPEPMRGLEVPPEVVAALGEGARPPVTITVNGHSWQSRVALMRGRYLLGLSNANRQAAGVALGDRKREHVHAIESAKKPDTRQRRIEKAIATLRG